MRRVLLVLLGLVLLYAGYILMDAWMDLHAMPAAQTDTVDGNTISTVALEAKAAKVDSLSLDGAVMLDAMMDDLSSGGYTAACFDIKRADGTVGYASTLGTVAAAGAVSSPPGICAPLVKSWARMTCWCWGTLCAIRTMCRPLPIRPGR